MEGRGRWVLVAVVLGSGMVFLDSTVVTVALPAIGQALPTPRLGVLEAQSYVYNAYLLSLGSLLILAGALGDIHGRRRLYAIGMAGFGVTSLLCGIAPTMETLIAARLLQGAAGAVLVPGSLAIITATFEGEERGRAFGVWAGASAGATILGPIVGGVLVDTVSWRAVFLLNLPLAAVGLWVTRHHVAESRDPTSGRRVDWLGSLAAAVAVGGLTFGAIRGQEHVWQDATAYVALAVGLAAAVGFVVLMAHSTDPLVPLELFAARNFTVTNVSTVVIYGGLYVMAYFIVLFLQGTLGYNAAAAGAATIPTVVFLALFSTRFGTLAARHGPRWFMAAGPVVMAGGALLLARVPASAGAWTLLPGRPATWWPPADYVTAVLPGLLLLGVGIMIVVAPLTTALMNSVPESRSGVASALNNALSRVGPQLATALLFVAVTASFYGGLADRLQGVDPAVVDTREQFSPLNPPGDDATALERQASREASTDAFHLAMLAAAGLLLVGGVVNGLWIRNPERSLTPARSAECLPGAAPP